MPMKATLLSKSGLTDRPEYPLEEGKTYLVGRSREANIIVKDKLASRNHCRVASSGPEEWTVADLGSSNGTYVNRQRITTRVLRHGDVVQIGKVSLEYRLLTATTAPTVVSFSASSSGFIRKINRIKIMVMMIPTIPKSRKTSVPSRVTKRFPG